MLINSDFNVTVLRVVAVNRLYNYATDSQVHNKGRNRWAMALKRAGKTYYTVNGRQILSDSTHPVILPMGCAYSWQCVESGDCILVEFEALEACGDILSFTVPDNGFILRDSQKIQKCLLDPAPGSRMECVRLLYGLLVQLIKTAAREYIPREKQRLLQPAMNCIFEKYYIPDITNEQLARLCGISTVYFRKCFEASYGVSPIRYLHDFRIQKAKDLLSSDYGSISQVAESVGYRSIYHFSKMFKAYTGLNPSEYAKASRR